MKFLLDDNLSWRLIKKLSKHFPELIHASAINLSQPATDIAIWNFAKKNNFTIITKDDDFEKLVLLKKAPPKVIYLKTYNLDTKSLAQLLIDNKNKINFFCNSEENEILEIYSN